MRHRIPRARGQPLRAVRSRNVVRLFRPLGRNWTTRINSGRPTVRLPQTEGRLAPEMAESHEARSQAQAQRRAWSQCIATWAASGVAVPRASLVLSFAPKESTTPFGAAAPPPAPESARQSPRRGMRLKGFPLAFWKPSDTKSGQKPTKTAFLALSAKWPRIAIDWEVLRRKPSSRPALSCALPVGEP